MASERFEVVDQSSPTTEFRFDCCPEPTPIVTRDVDDPKAWEVECEACGITLCYLTAPDESSTILGPTAGAGQNGDESDG